MRTGTNLPRVGGFNRAVVLEAIRRQERVSRIELARLTGLTNQTVSNVVRRLLDEGLVVETGRAPSSGGKRATLLSVRADAYCAVGVHLDPDSVVAVLVDLAGGVLQRRRLRTLPRTDPDAMVRRIASVVASLVTRAGCDPRQVLGVGVAAPGPLDVERGVVLDPPNLPEWHEVELVRQLTAATGHPVVLDNDATAAAIGERWAGGPERSGSFLFVYLGAGVGGGIMLPDAVLRGDSGNAGEFGHMVVDPAGADCHCGGRGCLETVAAPGAVLAGLDTETVRRLGLDLSRDRRRADWTRLAAAATRGDPAAEAAVERAARAIGAAALSAVNLLDVGRIVIGGDGLRGIGPRVLAEVDAQVNGHSIARRVRRVPVEPSVIGEEVGAVGAASLVLHGNYAPGWRMLLADTVPPGR